jgi:hypothetical protein
MKEKPREGKRKVSRSLVFLSWRLPFFLWLLCWNPAEKGRKERLKFFNL